MLIIPIDKSTIYIRLHETIVLTMKPKASTNRLQGIYNLVLGKLRTIQATEVDFQNRGTGESGHQSGFIQKIAAIFKDFSRTTLDFPLNSLSTTIYILSWTTKKHQKTLSRPLHSKLKKIQGLFKDLHRNLRTFQGKMEFKDFSRTFPKIQGLFKTARTVSVRKGI